MDNNSGLFGGITGTILGAAGTITASLGDIYMVVGLISIILGIIASTISIIGTVVGKIKNAKADGKITSEEIEDIAKTAVDGVNDIKNRVESIQNLKKGEDK